MEDAPPPLRHPRKLVDFLGDDGIRRFIEIRAAATSLQEVRSSSQRAISAASLCEAMGGAWCTVLGCAVMKPTRAAVTREELRRYFPDGSYGGRMQPLPEYGCIFVKNAKAGTSTVLLWLHRIHTGDHGWTPEVSIHREHSLPRAKDVGWDVVARMLDGEAFRFSFIRDPIRRVESAYLDKIATDKPPEKPWRRDVQRTLRLPEDPGRVPTLEEFVAALELQEPLRMDPHWRPQHLNLMHPLVEFDVIGRLENLAADLAKVREAVGFPEVPLEVRNRSQRSTDSLFDGRPDLLRRVREVYARDLELYGY